MVHRKRRFRRIIVLLLMVLLIFFVGLVYFRYLDLKKTFIVKASEKASSVIGQKVLIHDLTISLTGAINLYDMKRPEQ